MKVYVLSVHDNQMIGTNDYQSGNSEVVAVFDSEPSGNNIDRALETFYREKKGLDTEEDVEIALGYSEPQVEEFEVKCPFLQ